MSAELSPDAIYAIAAKISPGPLGLVVHRPEAWAKPRLCFPNVWRKVELAGGRERYGWTFHHRIAPDIGKYVFVTHHAVWNSPEGHLTDVTPFHDDPRHHPLMIDGSILFLVDDDAKPVVRESLLAPLPLRFFALGDSDKITRYVQGLNEAEQAKMQQVYERP